MESSGKIDQVKIVRVGQKVELWGYNPGYHCDPFSKFEILKIFFDEFGRQACLLVTEGPFEIEVTGYKGISEHFLVSIACVKRVQVTSGGKLDWVRFIGWNHTEEEVKNATA